MTSYRASTGQHRYFSTLRAAILSSCLRRQHSSPMHHGPSVPRTTMSMSPDNGTPGSDTELWQMVGLNPGALSRSSKDYFLTSDSIDLATGEFAGFHADFLVPGSFPLSLTRYFRPHVSYSSTAGRDMAWILDTRLIVGPGLILLVDHDGAVIEFDTTDPRVHACRSGPFRLIAETATGYQVMGENYTIWHFTADRGETKELGSCRTIMLSALTSRTGHRIRFIRDSDGRPECVEHSSGITIIPKYQGTVVASLVVRGPGFDVDLPVDPSPYSGRTANIPRSSLSPDRSHPVTVKFSDGTAEHWWFDPALCLRGWVGRGGQMMRRQVNAHRQTVTLDSSDDRGVATAVTIQRNDVSEPVVITTASTQWLIGYAYPGCIATVRAKGRTVSELASATWSGPDSPSTLTTENHHLIIETSDTGALLGVYGSIGSATCETDALGLPVHVTAANGQELWIERDFVADTISLTDPAGNVRVLTACPSSMARKPVTPTPEKEFKEGAVAERFLGHRAHAVVISGQRVSILRDAGGEIISVRIEGTGAVSGGQPFDGVDSVSLALDIPPSRDEASLSPRHGVASVVDPDTGQLVAIIDDYDEVSIPATCAPNNPRPGHTVEWVHQSGLRWTGDLPDKQLIPRDSRTFLESAAPGALWCLCACPLLDPEVSSESELWRWVSEVDQLVAAPHKAVNVIMSSIVRLGVRGMD